MRTEGRLRQRKDPQGLLLVLTLVNLVPSIPILANPVGNDASNPVVNNLSSDGTCPKPALSRVTRHKVALGETLESIARQYSLIPATLMGMNPATRQGDVAVGSEIVIPPYNGIRIEVPAKQDWRQVAANYKVRADVLFEVNGCQTSPKEVFVPGVNWSPERPVSVPSELVGYPLPYTAPVILGYGWQLNPDTGKVFFNSGLDLSATIGTPVRVVGAGTVAFAGLQGGYGNLVVVNHQKGRQSRYAHLQSVSVRIGQTVNQGSVLGTVGVTGKPTVSKPHLHIEMRYRSALGWVAEDPSRHLQQRKAAGR